MSSQASRMIAAIIALTCACLAGTAGLSAEAQPRFHVLSDDSVDTVSGMHIYVIRDEARAVCFALFVLAPSDSGPGGSVEPLAAGPRPEQLEKMRLGQALREATALRDRRVDELRQRNDMWPVNYEVYRERIEEEYERSVRALLPELFPAAQIVAGLRTTGTDALNDVVRRAIADGDAAEAAASRSVLDDQLLRLLGRGNTSPTLAVSGPLACRAAQ
jgi:hypothetical protein